MIRRRKQVGGEACRFPSVHPPYGSSPQQWWAWLGSGERPVVSFVPNWTKIFIGDSITMTCLVDSAGREDLVYYWYYDHFLIYTGKSYTIQQAQESDAGNYQCQTSTNQRSDSARLDVYTGYVLLQTPLHVYEGDNVTLRCHHYPGYSSKQTIFYKDQGVIQDWGDQADLLVQNVDLKSIWRYSCTKQVYHNLLYYQHSDEATISVQELFSSPLLQLKEARNVTLTCHTSLTPHRRATELQFAFYRNGQKVQNFSRVKQITIPSSWLRNSATYTCQVRTSTNTVEKTSAVTTEGKKR
ncbi:Fc receptor-like protein 3, partial [Gastrophryne carolinensis]